MSLGKKVTVSLFILFYSPFGEQIIESGFNFLNQNEKTEILHFLNRLIINKLYKCPAWHKFCIIKYKIFRYGL